MGSFAEACASVYTALKMKCHLVGDRRKQWSIGRDIDSISVTVLD